jgi:3-phenylpropionate/trans-cinnamate dioxygenase ferredoxin reductase subunit
VAEQNAHYVLVGGGLASASAADAIRKQDKSGSIAIISDENRVPYNRPPLTKEYLRGQAEAKDVPIQAAEWYRDRRIALMLGRTATEINTTDRTVRLNNGDSVRYEKLLIATGARPVKPDIPGSDLPNVQTMRYWSDSEALKPFMKQRLVIIGGGYIGLEVSAGSAQEGGRPIILERSNRMLGRSISPQLSEWFTGKLKQAGVEIVFNIEVQSITPSGVITKDGRTFEADRVLMATGVKPNIELAQAAGLAMDEDAHGVIVDEYLATSVPNVWAAGDIASFNDPVLGKRWRVEHYNNAQWHGEIAGANMAGLHKPYDHVANFFSYELDIQFELFGDPQNGRHAVFHGDPSSNRFDELYTNDDGQVVMVVSINPPEDLYPVLEQLPRVKPAIKGREGEISKEEFDLKTLVG